MNIRAPWRRSDRRPKRILEPANQEELLRGWLFHAHKARDRHERAARYLENRRYWFGGAAIALSAAAGYIGFAASGESADFLPPVWIGVIGIGGAVAAGLQTFLDYPGRASRHHAAATRYKALIRELEQVLTDRLDPTAVTAEWTADLRARLDALEEATPVVGDDMWREIESDFVGARLVGCAEDLSPSRADEPSATERRAGRAAPPEPEARSSVPAEDPVT